MATVISVISQKGGSGKTTLTQCLAIEALRQGLAAAIIDADPQKSAADWGAQREQAGIDAPAVITLGTGSLRAVVKELQSRGAEFIVIDTPPHSAPAINAALEVSTGAAMVTRPNPMDIRALEATWAIVDRMKKPSATIFTQTPPGNRAKALAFRTAQPPSPTRWAIRMRRPKRWRFRNASRPARRGPRSPRCGLG
jgi:chromosome partitioning protein